MLLPARVNWVGYRLFKYPRQGMIIDCITRSARSSRIPRAPSLHYLLVVCLALVLGACAREQGPDDALPEPLPASRAYVESGDLDALRDRGLFRILTQRREATYLPRDGYPLDQELRLAARFARSVGLKPVAVYVEDFAELIPALLEGRGDAIAANLTVTGPRQQRLQFTVPVGRAREQIVTRSEDDSIETLADLAGRTLTVIPDTTFWDTAQQIRERVPGLRIEPAGAGANSVALLERVATGALDLTIADSNVLDVVLDYRTDLQPVLDVSPPRPLAWAIRPQSPQLLEALNRFLNTEQLTRRRPPTYTGDLPELRKRKVLRLITRNTAATYFLWRGELRGFEYELAKRFADKLGLRLEVVVAPDNQALLPMLIEGKGDIVAAFLTPSEKRESLGVGFSRPYHYASETVVGRSDEPLLESTEALAGRSFAVRPSSSYWQTLTALRDSGVDLEIIEAPETLDTEEIIARVAEGEYDLTLADSHFLDVEQTWRQDVHGLLTLGEPIAHGWAVRKQDEKLLAAIDDFLRKEYRGEFYNIVYERYFRDPHSITRYKEGQELILSEGRLSPYDDLVKKYAQEYGFDWQLIVAQMYQESRFDPEARSWAGAQGLMQVLPRTGKEFGFENLKDPETGIHAGIRYLDWLRDRFEPELDVRERMLFTLAAYNAGAGHIRDARSLARKNDLDPDRWFGNVEEALRLKSKRKHAKHTRHGYVRASETVKYVRQIQDRYLAYKALTAEASAD